MAMMYMYMLSSMYGYGGYGGYQGAAATQTAAAAVQTAAATQTMQECIGPCVNGGCPAGYTCNANNVCCRTSAGK
ncbi:hypothetical protein OESDEN_04197 [Oesophagostomum dentatum]|uniref:CC domain-containing protein n=1 Tax=Oesophagostomum dentatum TaxID=61180 RepID=A0A0B1TJ48_OESDE|nr:hypothetical protein OESDEN_04197 [Oesophagostomum dentatum]